MYLLLDESRIFEVDPVMAFVKGFMSTTFSLDSSFALFVFHATIFYCAESKGAKTGKSKKKNRRKKTHIIGSSNEDGDHEVSVLLAPLLNSTCTRMFTNVFVIMSPGRK